jgi:hypothetical protein
MFVEAQKHTQMWECKECHQRISDEENVTYCLIGGILYGWCERCFSRRRQTIN